MENEFDFELGLLPQSCPGNLDLVYEPCELQIKMKSGRNLPEDARFDFYLYDEDSCTLMGYVRQGDKPTAYVVEKKKVDATMGVKMPWAGGRYTLLAKITTPKKNRFEEAETEVVKAEFLVTFDENLEYEMQVEVVSTELCHGITPDSVLATCLGRDEAPQWCSFLFQRIPGIKPVKQWLVQRRQWDEVNGLLEKGKSDSVKFWNNYIISAKTMSNVSKLSMFIREIAYKDYASEFIDCEFLYDELTPADPYHKVKEMFPEYDETENVFETVKSFGTKEIFFIRRIGILSTEEGRPILNALLRNVICTSPDKVIVVMGTEEEVDALLKAEPSLQSFFPAEGRMAVGTLSYPETLRYMVSRMAVHGMRLNRAGEIVMRYEIRKGFLNGNLKDWTTDDVERYIVEKLKPRYAERISAGVDTQDEAKSQNALLVDCDDIDRCTLSGEEDSSDSPEKGRTSLLPEGTGEAKPDTDEEFERMLDKLLNSMMDMPDEDAPDVLDDDLDDPKEEAENDFPSDDTDFDFSGLDDMDSTPDNERKIKFTVLPPIKDPKAELDKLVGCTEIKQRIEQLTMFSRYNRLIQKMNPTGKRHNVSLHSIFFGRPGTGKTTVCKIMGSLLRRSGALSVGHVVVCNRRDFIGTRWGDEERVVRQAVEEARGGVLMIDEAYQLDSGNPHDPGRLVIPLLMDILSDETQRDIAIVLCGYKKEMKRLIDLNPGLTSRFPNVFEFKDFTIDELLEITERRVGEYGYGFTRAAWRKYRAIIEEAYKVRDANTWGNARYVANLLDNIYLHHAMRCVRKNGMDRHHLYQITPADVQPIETAKPKPRIGF